MNKERLLTLAAFLDKVPPDHFDLGSWRRNIRKNSEAVSDTELVNHDCGTTACAIGWACTIPAFNALGFDILDQYYTSTPSYEVHTGWSAVVRFFDLSYQDSQYLFDKYEYVSREREPKHVANRIRRFCES